MTQSGCKNTWLAEDFGCFSVSLAKPHRQKVALCILSLRVHAIPLRVAPMPAVRYDLNGGLPTCIRLIVYQEYMVIVYCYVFCKPDMVSVSILVE